MKTFIITLGLVVLLLGGAVYWSKSAEKNDTSIVSTNGLHYHPELEIFVKGEKIVIPQNIGLGVTHNPIHTHDDVPIIHLEFQGKVRTKDLTLNQFFKSWGKDITFFGANPKMTVNGVENALLGDYVMQDKDKIVLKYE